MSQLLLCLVHCGIANSTFDPPHGESSKDWGQHHQLVWWRSTRCYTITNSHFWRIAFLHMDNTTNWCSGGPSEVTPPIIHPFGEFLFCTWTPPLTGVAQVHQKLHHHQFTHLENSLSAMADWSCELCACSPLEVTFCLLMINFYL